MVLRRADGSAGDADYGTIGAGYSTHRRPEPRIAAFIEEALAGAETVLNVGTGAGSYEPESFESGAWDERFGPLRSQPELLGSLVMVRALPA